ncbi:hypothetical protein [Glycomyces niveus]|uniref:Uncharacterized protein n=1 Tax=Glycomyces niveus TaxID=2820287 RepID=A0ABS3U8D4_9ACTN|nr:hypothetical protein [Glycomyces sp. NEAU-S30]MBO3735044.1 hypothetical protein [Glycomyces sp. NEAU-S30]
MTFIYDVMTWTREGTRVEGRITSLERDPVKFYEGPEFGLQLLMDAWFNGCGALTVDKDAAREFERCFELFLGKKVWTDAEGHVLDEATKEPLQPKVKAETHFAGRLDSARGYWDGYDYLVLKPDRQGFLDRTAEVIASFRIEGSGTGEHADILIEATDPKYVSHMDESHHFKTTFTGHLPR